MAEPTTQAGRSLLGYLSSLKVPEAPNWPEHERRTILAIEQEARVALLSDLRERVAALPRSGIVPNGPYIWRSAVLDLLASQDAPASVTDEL